MSAIASAVYSGSVIHQRLGTPRHRLAYPLFMWLLDLDELPMLERWLPGFGHNRARPVSFRDADHFEGGSTPPRQALRRLVEESGLEWPSGPVRVLTHCRVFGYVFNPVSFWYCFTPGGEVGAIVAEVNNTYGERHCYVAGGATGPREPVAASGSAAARWHPERATDGSASPTFVWRDKKVFHVSPFLSLDGTYHFGVQGPGDRLHARIDLRVDGTVRVATSLRLAREPLSRASAVRILLRYPFMTVRVIGAIHWEAFRLWRKGARFHAKPSYDPQGARQGAR